MKNRILKIGTAAVLILLCLLAFLQHARLQQQEKRLEALEDQLTRLSAQEPPSPAGTPSLIRAAETGLDSSVLISVYDTTKIQTGSDTFMGEPETHTGRVLAGQASGVLIREELVLTCYHIIADRAAVTVTSAHGEPLEAEVVQADPVRDLVLLKVPGLRGTPAVFGDSRSLQPGQVVLCIGSPASRKLAFSVTAGIISGLDRKMGSLTQEDKTVTVFQTDAPINGGSSGGGIFTLEGELVGIVSRKYIGSRTSETQLEGIGMCIPIRDAAGLLAAYDTP